MLKLVKVFEMIGLRVELLLLLMSQRFPIVGQHLRNGGSIVSITEILKIHYYSNVGPGENSNKLLIWNTIVRSVELELLERIQEHQVGQLTLEKWVLCGNLWPTTWRRSSASSPSRPSWSSAVRSNQNMEFRDRQSDPRRPG